MSNPKNNQTSGMTLFGIIPNVLEGGQINKYKSNTQTASRQQTASSKIKREKKDVNALFMIEPGGLRISDGVTKYKLFD